MCRTPARCVPLARAPRWPRRRQQSRWVVAGLSAWSLREDKLVLCGQAESVAVVAVADDDFAGADEQVATVDMAVNDLDRPLFHGSGSPFSCRGIGGVLVGPRVHLVDASQYTDV